eukprot:2863461-Amphidinium_carterae.1
MSVAYKNAVSSRRAAWRTLHGIAERERLHIIFEIVTDCLYMPGDLMPRVLQEERSRIDKEKLATPSFRVFMHHYWATISGKAGYALLNRHHYRLPLLRCVFEVLMCARFLVTNLVQQQWTRTIPSHTMIIDIHMHTCISDAIRGSITMTAEQRSARECGYQDKLETPKQK